MIAAHAKADAAAAFDAAEIEAPITYAESCLGPDAADPPKKGSRWNALRHGCMAQLLLPADLALEAEHCTAVLTAEYRPTSAHEVGIIKTMGRLAAQMERIQTLKVIDRQRSMDRAVVCWDYDKYIYVDQLAERLATDPVGISRALGRSKQGVAWLMKIWDGLIDAHDTNGYWNEAQCHLAMNLLGYPLELRNGSTAITPETDAAVVDEVVATELDRLGARIKGHLIATDHADKWMVAAGMPDEEDAQTKRLRKDEGRVRLAYRRSKGELLESVAQAAAEAAGSAPTPTPAPVVSGVRTDPDAEPGPKPRPTTSNAAYNFLAKRSMLEGFEIPATATAPAQTVRVRFPFEGGDVPTEDEAEGECEPECECEPEAVSLVEPVPVPPPTTRVAINASHAAVNNRLDRERHQRRAQQKKARKAARRRGR